jgi:hypothetical protein
VLFLTNLAVFPSLSHQKLPKITKHFVGCRVTSKTLGIGPCERSWGALKSIKTGKRSAIKAESIEKRTILYTTAFLNNARIDREQYEKMDCSDPQAAFCIDALK